MNSNASYRSLKMAQVISCCLNRNVELFPVSCWRRFIGESSGKDCMTQISVGVADGCARVVLVVESSLVVV